MSLISSWPKESSALPSAPAKKSRGLARLCISGFLLLAATHATGAHPKVVGSASGRFYAVGSNNTELAAVVKWAETVADKTERATGLAIKGDADKGLYIVLSCNDREAPAVRCSQSYANGRLVQQLAVINPQAADWEDALEELCMLLASRLIVDRQDIQQRSSELGTAPAWLAAGLAQYIDPALRERNGKSIADWKATGDKYPPFSEVLKWNTMPRGRSLNKAICGAACARLCAMQDKEQRFDLMLRRLAKGQPLSTDWASANLLESQAPGSMEEQWTLWLQREGKTIISPGSASIEWLDQLRAELVARPGDAGVPETPNGSEIELEPLIAEKKKGWIPQFCRTKIGRIRGMIAGRSADSVRAAEAYVTFFNELGLGKRDGTLKRLLARADAQLEELDKNLQAIDRYMDAAEQRLTPPPPTRDLAPETSQPMRSAIQLYVDEVERRTGEPQTIDLRP